MVRFLIVVWDRLVSGCGVRMPRKSGEGIFLKLHKGSVCFGSAIQSVCAVTLAIYSCAAKAEGNFTSIKQSVNSYVEAYNSMLGSLESIDSDVDSYSSKGKSDREVLRDYYNGLRRAYLVEGLRLQREPVLAVVDTYSQATSAAVTSYVKFVRGDAAFAANKDVWEQCLKSKGADFDAQEFLGNAKAALSESYMSVEQGLQQDFKFRRGRYESGGGRMMNGTLNSQLDRVTAALDRDWRGALESCCAKSSVDPETCKQKGREFFVDGAGRPTEQNIAALVKIAIVPDPIENTQLKPAVLSQIIQSGDLNRATRVARLSMDADAELEALNKAELACSRARANAQDKSGTHSMTKSLVQSLGKTLKCQVLPFYGVQNLNTEYQRMTTAVANVPIQGRDWDINCDPRESAFYDSLRPTDPNVIAKQWGINDNMSNPPWISMLRNMQPVQSPFPIVALPGAGVVTPYGIVGRSLGETSSTSTSSAVVSNATAGSRGTLITTAAASSKALASPVSASRLNIRRAPSRGLAQGTAATSSIRSVAVNISRGKSVAANVAALQSGSSKTRALAQNIASNNGALSAAARRDSNTVSATTGRTMVRNLVGARASRTSAESIATSVAGYRSGNRTQATPNMPQGQSLADIEAKNEQDKLRLENLARMYAANIESAKKQAEAVRQQIFQQIMARDMKVTNLVAEILNKPPKTQASKVMQTRKEMMLIDRELGQLKAQYDTYVGSVLEQASLMRNVIALGTGNSVGLGNTWDPRLMGSANSVPATGNGPPPPSLFLPPALMPQNIPALAPGFPAVQPPVARQGTLENRFFDIFRKWQLIPEAYAATQKNLGVFHNEIEWRAGFERFKEDLFKYADAKKAAEKSILTKAAEALYKQSSSITPENARDFDTEALTAIELYSQSMSDEVGDLIESSTQSKISLAPEFKSSLEKVANDSKSTLESLEKIALQYKDSYPLSDEENPEVWWAMLPEMLIY